MRIVGSRRPATTLLLVLAASSALAGAATRADHRDALGRSHVVSLEKAFAGGTELRYALDGAPGRVLATASDELRGVEVLCDGACATLAIGWERVAAQGESRWFVLSYDGGLSFTEPRPAKLVLPMRYGNIVPYVNEPEVPVGLRADGTSRLYLVQFETISTEAWRQGVRQLGAEILAFVPWQAHVVRMDASVAAQVQSLPYVHWVGAYHPAYRLDEDVLHELASGIASPPRGYNVVALEEGQAHQERIAAEVLRVGGVVVRVANDGGGRILNAVLDVGQVVEVARSNDVLWIDETGVPQDDMDIARDFHGATYIEGILGYNGQGVFGEVLDGGTMLTHQDFDGIQQHPGISVPAGDHGTCTYGIVFGNGDRDGDGNAQGTGMLPGTTGWVGYYNSLPPNRKTYTAALLQSPMFCVFQSNSWGNPQTSQYTSISQEMDDIIFTHDLTILNSMSNLGNQQVRPEAWAKNVVAVGALYHFNTLTPTDDRWNNGASIGPAADGRIKPDIMSYYDATYTTDREPGGYAAGLYYPSFGGTSGATPISAGAFGLFYQMWAENVFNTNPVGSTVFEKRCHSITARSMVQNLSFLYPIGSGTGQAQRVWQGWGVPNLQNLYDNRNRVNVIDESVRLQQGQSENYCMQIPAGTPNLRITMSYMDPPGTTSSSQHRINDLSLVVIDPFGTTYYGNVGLSTANVSSPGGAKDTMNVTEHVFVDAPIAGNWSITVVADEINVDAHVPSPAVDADYALVVTGVFCPGVDCCSGAAPTANFAGNPTSGGAPLLVSFTDLSTNGPTSWAWDFGDGGTSTVQSPSHTYASPGLYTVSLTAGNASGSDVETKTDYVTVLGVPVADFSGNPTSGSAPLSVDFTDLTTNGPTSWAWDFGDGGTSTSQNPTHVYNTPGSYTVSLTATSPQGSDTETKTGYITVTPAGQPPVAEFSGSPTSGSAPLSVTFTDLSTNAPGSWAWDFGDGGTSTSQSPTHVYGAAGSYSVALTATNAFGSDTETKVDYIVVTAGQPPVAEFSGTPTTGNAPLQVTFTDLSTNAPTSWAWDFGDGGTSIQQSPSYVYAAAGTYTVALTATNASGSDTETKVDYVVVTSGQPPVAEFSGTPTSGTAPLTVDFTDLSTNAPTSWAWDFGDGGSDASQNPTHVYGAPGSYTVSLTATNAFGSDTETKSAYVTVVAGFVSEEIVSGAGPAPGNAPVVKTWDHASPPAVVTTWAAYAAPGYGSNVGAVDMIGGGIAEVATAPGPGVSYGPQVRGFVSSTGAAIAKVNYFAYGTLNYGAHAEGGDLDGDAHEELVTSPGPGAVFGPHIRGWNYDGAGIATIAKVNFFAYNTLRYGARTAAGSLDADAFAEIVTGAGAGQVFTPHVRTFDYDNVGITARASFFAFATGRYGASVATGSTDGDVQDELVAAHGPDVTANAEVKGYDVTGATVSNAWTVTTFTTLGGAEAALGDLDADGTDELVASPGWGTSNPSRVRGYEISGGSGTAIPGLDYDAYPGQTFGTKVAVGDTGI